VPSQESLRFVRVNYDDRRRFPWVVLWGDNHEWCSCRSRDHALDEASKLRGVCEVFYDWKTNLEGK
jgi:hypothetical protein